MTKSSSPKKSNSKKGSPKKSSKKSPDKSSKKGKSPKSAIELTEAEKEASPVTHVIFDLDGVLVDSVRCYEEFVDGLIWPYDRFFVPLSLKTRMAWQRTEYAARLAVKGLVLPMTVEEFMGYHRARKPALLRAVELKAGVSRLVEYFRSHNMPMAVVTDSTEEAYNHKISRHQLIFNKFSHSVCYGSDHQALRRRPSPEIYELAASRFTLNLPKSSYNVLVFEDATVGVDAAIAANMKVVWIPDPRVDTSLHNFYNNLMVIKSLEHFQPQLFGLPYFSDLYTI